MTILFHPSYLITSSSSSSLPLSPLSCFPFKHKHHHQHLHYCVHVVASCLPPEQQLSSSSSSSSSGWRRSSARPWAIACSGKACEGLPLERFFATCAPGLEEVVAAELRSAMIGAVGVEIGSAGVSFQGTCSTGFKANLWLRSAVRVLQELSAGSLSRGTSHRDPVYEFVRDAADWPNLLIAERDDFDGAPENNDLAFLPMHPESTEKHRSRVEMGRIVENQLTFRTFDVQTRVWDCGRVSNANSASTRSKDAICDAIRDACHGRKPKSPKETGKVADLPLFLSLYRNRAILYRDMSGASLHKRGYRDVMHKAGLNEGIAAAILTMAGWSRWIPGFGVYNKNALWEGDDGCNGPVLVDPMCGSGTILIEAALMAANIAPGLMRASWPFMTWHDFNLQNWRDCQSQAFDARMKTPPGLRILGNDNHEGALSLCVRNAKTAGICHLLELSCQDCSLYIPPIAPSLVVVNPPWGSRLGDDSAHDSEWIACTWTALGKFLKRSCTRADVYVLSGNANATRDLQLKSDKKWHLTVGGVDCKLLHYYVLPPKQKEADI